MKKLLIYFPIAAIVGLRLLSAQAPAEKAVERLDPALDALVAPDAKLETLGATEQFGVTEGPVWVREGNSGFLLFSDIPANAILKWTPDDKVSVFLDNSGYTGTDVKSVCRVSNSGRLYVCQIGSNGLTLDPQGRLVIAAEGYRAVVRIERDGTRTVLAKSYGGKPLVGPNDVIVKSDGTLYFTDGAGFFMVKDGNVQLSLEKDPEGGFNGLAFSPDEKLLYISSAGKTLRYDVRPDDTLTNRQVLMNVGTDGMKVDQKGNIYFAVRSSSGEGAKGGLWIASPDGKHIGTIHVPPLAGRRGQGSVVKNMAFGDPDGKSLFICATAHLYRIRLKTAGIRPGVPSH